MMDADIRRDPSAPARPLSRLPLQGEVWKALGVRRGVTALIGGGGKTTLMYRLAAELAPLGRVIVTTSTKIRLPDHLPVLDPATPEALQAALAKQNPLCLGAPANPDPTRRGAQCAPAVPDPTRRGAQCAPAVPDLSAKKLTVPTLPCSVLAEAADYVIVEADGARGLPGKAHEAHEPVIPLEAGRVILVLGADAFGRPIREACHRPDLYAQRGETTPDALLTPELAARVIRAEGYGNIIYVNKCEQEADFQAAETLSRLLEVPVVAGRLL